LHCFHYLTKKKSDILILKKEKSLNKPQPTRHTKKKKKQMALFTATTHASSLFFCKKTHLKPTPNQHPFSLSFTHTRIPKPSFSFELHSSLPDTNSGPDPESNLNPVTSGITDEWGEKPERESEPEPETTKLADSDPPRNEDEWEDEYVSAVNGSAAQGQVVGEATEDGGGVIKDLKRCLVDKVNGTELGLRAGSELRAEVLELVNQLEAVNPTPAPVEAAELLDGNWVLLYTAFSELLPLLAAGTTPLLKVKRISQTIDSNSLSIVNSTTLSSPFATFSFSASAEFEVRSPSRIQVEFKEGTLQPPEIKSNVDLPETIEIFGQKINLSPVQQSLNPLQEAVASISRAISGLQPFKIPIPGNQTQSWLLVTYLDEDLRISRGDGGLFVLAKEGSPLLAQ
ncbi:PAP_fibrillin domain-containing protein, partial [Cephalotus follicularis]